MIPIIDQKNRAFIVIQNTRRISLMIPLQSLLTPLPAESTLLLITLTNDFIGSSTGTDSTDGGLIKQLLPGNFNLRLTFWYTIHAAVRAIDVCISAMKGF